MVVKGRWTSHGPMVSGKVSGEMWVRTHSVKEREKSRPGIQVHAKALRQALMFRPWKDSSRVVQREPPREETDKWWASTYLVHARHCSKHLMWIISANPQSNPMRYSTTISILEVRKLSLSNVKRLRVMQTPLSLPCPPHREDLEQQCFLDECMGSVGEEMDCLIPWAQPSPGECVRLCIHTPLTCRQSRGSCPGE